MQRIATTIETGRTRASQIIRKVSALSRKNQLFKALRNLGRLVRTRHILEIAGDKKYRKRILQGINKGESRNSLAKELRCAGVVSSGKKILKCNSVWQPQWIWWFFAWRHGIRFICKERFVLSCRKGIKFIQRIFAFYHLLPMVTSICMDSFFSGLFFPDWIHSLLKKNLSHYGNGFGQ